MIKLNAGELSKALSFIGQAYKSKTTLDIMQNVKIETSDSLCMLTYTNGEQELTYSLPVESKENESFTVELKKLRDRVSQYDKELYVKIKYDDVKNKATVSCGRSKITINGLPSSDYPSTETPDNFNSITFDGAELKKALATVKPAQAVNDVRHYLNGVYFQFESNKCSVVATDGHRMHVFVLDINSELETSCIVPASAIAPIHKFLDAGDIDVRISSNHLRISDSESSIQTNLIEGRFPDWSRVVPISNQGELTFNVSDLVGSIKGSMITANEKYKGVKITAENGNAKIESNSTDGTSSEEIVEAIMNNVDSIEFGVNGSYVLDSLSPIDDSNVTFYVKDGQSPMMIKEGGYMAVVMPMRL